MEQNKFKEAKNSFLTKFEIQFVKDYLMQYKGNVTNASKSAGMTRQNFQRLMKKHNIRSSEFRKQIVHVLPFQKSENVA
jgi:DNA-binding NtrC family response regulator